MTTLTVRNLDATTHAALKARAAAHGRSMESEARVILAATVASTADPETGLATRIADLFADVEWPGLERSSEEARAASFDE